MLLKIGGELENREVPQCHLRLSATIQQKQVDWGSYAYQCTKEQLEKLMEQTGCEIDKMNELASEKIYGIVFVEEV